MGRKGKHARVQRTFTAVYTGRKDDRVHGTRPCTGRVHGRFRVMYGRAPGSYTL